MDPSSITRLAPTPHPLMEGGAKPQIHDRHCCQLFTQPPEITLINLLEILPICMALKFLVVYEINLKVYNLVSPIPSQCKLEVLSALLVHSNLLAYQVMRLLLVHMMMVM